MNIRLYKSRKLEVQAVKFWSNSNSYILNVNNPYQTASKDEYTFYFKQMGPSGIIVGDFNGYHTMWNDQRQSNSTGSNLVSSLLNFYDYVLLTLVNLPTYYNIANRGYYTLDLAFVSIDLYPLS